MYVICANIYFKHLEKKKLIPNYAKIKVSYISPATKITQGKIQTLCLKDKIKFSYIKKEKLNNELYEVHLKTA
jgi:hypothetical protein